MRKPRMPKFNCNMSWDEYKELDYFCRQYHRKKAEADALLTLRVSTPEVAMAADGTGVFMPHGSGGISDPVAITAEKRERLLRDVRMIDQAAVIAGQDLAEYLLKSVTRKNGVRSVLCDVPCSERQFYRMRRTFFCVLKMMREG